jgi:hypothetical protein
MPKMQDAHIDRAMTNISVAYMQEASAFIADQVFPIVPVKRQSDVFYVYNKGDFMRDEAALRGAYSESAGGDYGVAASDPYYCRKHAFHKDVAPEERANYDEPLNADVDATEFVSQKMLIRREMEWATRFFKTGLWGTEINGGAAVANGGAVNGGTVVYWSTDTSDPIKDITSTSVTMASETGYRPNVLVLSPFVFNALKNHPDILDRIKYTQKGIVTNDLLATLFEVDKVLVAWSVVNSAAKGATDSVDFIMGKHALLCYSAPSPALKKPSAGYIFAWTGLEGSGAYGNRIVRLPMDMLGLGTERIEGELAFDAKQICADLGVFFKDIVQ